MKLPESFTTITPFSKLLALIIFISFPIFGFILGMKIKEFSPPKIVYIESDRIVKVYPTESPQSLIQRCGDLPSDSELKIQADRFTQISGPFWSPDCRHIAWASWESGTEGIKYEGPYPFEGLFLFTESNKEIKKIYSPLPGETVELKHWESKDSVTFSTDGINFKSVDVNL